MQNPKIILVAGPTASGKSALAMELARKMRGTIINADAMQIYSGLPILTAQPSAEDQNEIPHELYGVLDPTEKSSAGKWLALATKAIERTQTSGRTPILVGGTGLYFKALLGDLADIPPIPDDVHDKAQKLYQEWGEDNFRRELAKHDAASAARIAKNDHQRLMRAYEVAIGTGKTLGEWQRQGAENREQGSGLALIPDPYLLTPDRAELYAACNRRFLQMIERGAVEEARKFLARKLDPDLPAMKTLGLREIAAYLNGHISLEAFIAKAQQATRNYAKRQVTWLKNQWKIRSFRPYDERLIYCAATSK